MSEKYPQYPLTDFPKSVDTYEAFMDMSQTDYALVKQYQDALESQNLSLAQTIFTQIPYNTRKIISALRLNQLREAVLAMEKFYGTDVKPYIDLKQVEWEAYVDRFSYIGVYNPTTQYVKNNVIQYNDNGVVGLYLNISENPTPLGTLPTNTIYWRTFTVRGMQGIAGVGANFMFDWDSAFEYQPQTIVVYNNAWWVSTQVNQNEPPRPNSPYWNLVLNILQSIYPISVDQPQSQLKGELWFEVVG